MKCKECGEAWFKRHETDWRTVVYECGHTYTVEGIKKYICSSCCPPNPDICDTCPDCVEEYHRLEEYIVTFKCGHAYTLVDGSNVGKCSKPIIPDLVINDISSGL